MGRVRRRTTDDDDDNTRAGGAPAPVPGGGAAAAAAATATATPPTLSPLRPKATSTTTAAATQTKGAEHTNNPAARHLSSLRPMPSSLSVSRRPITLETPPKISELSSKVLPPTYPTNCRHSSRQTNTHTHGSIPLRWSKTRERVLLLYCCCARVNNSNASSTIQYGKSIATSRHASKPRMYQNTTLDETS